MNMLFKFWKTIGPLAILSLGVLFVSFKNMKNVENEVTYKFPTTSNETSPEEFDRHEAFYKKRIERSPKGGLDLAILANLYVTKAKFSGDLGFMDKAEILARQSLIKSPYYNYEAQLILIKVAESRHQFQEAINLAQKVLKDKPFHQGALLALVSSSLGFGKLKLALNYANQLININPAMEPYAMRALVFLAQGKDEQAMDDFENALKSETSDEPRQSAWVRSLIGRYFLKHGQIKNAELYLNSALKISPEFHMALALLADIEVQRENYEAANLLFTKAIIAKEEPPYLMRQAKLKDHLGDKIGASKLRSQAEMLIREEMANGPYGHHNELAQLLLDRGDRKELPEAIAEAKKDAEARGTSESYYLLSQSLFQAGFLKEAKRTIAQALDSGVNSCEYQKLDSLISSQMGGLKYAGHFSRECLKDSISSLLNSVGML